METSLSASRKIIGSRYVAERTGIASLAIFIFAFTILCTKLSRPTQGPKFNIRTSAMAVRAATVQSSAISIMPDPPIANDQLESQFEMLWPGHKLPPWAKKSTNYDVPRSQSMCFVHVGKAGGSAIGCSLGFSLHCGNSTQIDGVLPKITTTIFHKDVYNCHDDEAYYLFAIRDPVERAISAFNYDRPDISEGYIYGRYIRFYEDCSFSTIEEMVQNGLSDDGNATDYCKNLAFRAVRGKGWKAPSHFYYNYQYYWESIPRGSPVIVIRNENLIQDWNSLEEKLSGRNDMITEEIMPVINANNANRDDSYISSESLKLLCQALCNEIQIYKQILSVARNLDRGQVAESLDALALKCPVERRIDTCTEPMPDIRKKIKGNRGYLPSAE